MWIRAKIGDACNARFAEVAALRCRIALRRSSACHAVDPARRAVAIVLFFPNGYALLEFIYDVAAGIERDAPVRCANTNPDRALADLQTTHAVLT